MTNYPMDQDELIHEVNNAQTIIGCACRRLQKQMTYDEAYPFITIIRLQIDRIEAAYEQYCITPTV